MTELLKKVFDLASKLSPEEQDALASLIMAEIEDDRRWDAAFGASQPALEKLAQEALEEYRSGRTTPLEFDDDVS